LLRWFMRRSAHALSLNDVCDALKLCLTPLFGIRAAKPPGEKYTQPRQQGPRLRHGQEVCAGRSWRTCNRTSRVRARPRQAQVRLAVQAGINAVDSTTIQLVANCMDWAEAPAPGKAQRSAICVWTCKASCRSLPSWIRHVNTTTSAPGRCAPGFPRENRDFDKAYVDFAHLWDMAQRGISWVSRAKDNMACRVKKRLPRSSDRRILKDELIVLKGHEARQNYPGQMRR